MDSFTAKKLLSNIEEKYKFPQEVIDFEDLSIVINVLNYLIDKSEVGVENKNTNPYLIRYDKNKAAFDEIEPKESTNIFNRDSL